MPDEYIEMAKQIFSASEVGGRRRTWWFSTEKMTVIADCIDDIVFEASPVVSKFQGQHIKSLADWLRLQGGFEFQEISESTARP
jgi:hypothetical protein